MHLIRETHANGHAAAGKLGRDIDLRSNGGVTTGPERRRPEGTQPSHGQFRRHSTATPTVSVVIPALNEGANLPYVLERVPRWVHEVVVVDGHSSDDTVEVAKSVRPDVVIVYQTGKGKGNAIIAGAEAATGDIVVLLDADGSTDPGDIPRFVAALRTGADFAKGTRFLMGAGSADLTPTRRFGSKLFAHIVNVLFGSSYTDVLYGYNAFWRRCLPDLQIDCNGFEVEPLLAIRAMRSNIRVIEVPSYEPPRLSGATNLRAVRDGWRILRMIIAERIRPV